MILIGVYDSPFVRHADIATGAALRFLGEAHPRLVPMSDFPALSAYVARLEALRVFRTVSQSFIPTVEPVAGEAA